MIKKYIGKIITRGRIMLFYAKCFWPEAITHMIWPFAISKTINLENSLVLDANGRSPLQKLTLSDAQILLRDQYI